MMVFYHVNGSSDISLGNTLVEYVSLLPTNMQKNIPVTLLILVL